MSVNYSSTSPVAEAKKKLCKYQTDGTNVSLEFDLDVKSTAISATGDITITAIDTVERCTAGASDITRTLPIASSCTDCFVTVKKVDSGAGAVIVQGNGSPAQAIDGDTQYYLTNQYQYVTLMSNGSGWDVVGEKA